MTNKPARKRVRGSGNLVRRVLELVVRPVFEERAMAGADGEPAVELVDDDGETFLQGVLERDQLVTVLGRSIDHERTELRIQWMAGVLAGEVGGGAFLVGAFLEPSSFHLEGGAGLGMCGVMVVTCDLVVRRDDEPLVRQRVNELLILARNMEWFFPLRLPSRLRWMDLQQLEIPWAELPHGELDEFLDAGLRAPRSERAPQILVRIAQGLGRWEDVLRLFREHAEEFTRYRSAPMRAMAHRELGRWLPAVAVAKEGGIREGRYGGGPWLSPSYLHALIEGGDDIEALRLLGRTAEDEPGFYDWMRGLALHRAGDFKGSERAFASYFQNWPGDVIGFGAQAELEEEE